MAKRPAEWLAQADYDIETAELMISGGRHFYAVFMCHLAVEKALKVSFKRSWESFRQEFITSFIC